MIKNYIQEYLLKKAYRVNNRDVQIANFKSVKTIGLLSNPKSEKDIIEINSIIKHLQGLGKQINPLIFFDKQIENNPSAKGIDCIGLNKDNCSWTGKAKNELNLNRFIKKKFDVLIDLSFTEIYSLQYIFIESKARIKCMPTNDFSRQYADVMLETFQSQSKLAFTKELIHYLEIINKK